MDVHRSAQSDLITEQTRASRSNRSFRYFFVARHSVLESGPLLNTEADLVIIGQASDGRIALEQIETLRQGVSLLGA
jgi:hypothetical protein